MEKRKESRPRFTFGTPTARQSTTAATDLFAESKTQSFGEILKSQKNNFDSKQLRDLQDNVSRISRENDALAIKKKEQEARSKSIRDLSILLNDYYHQHISIMEFKKENEITPELVDNMIIEYNLFLKNQISIRLTTASLNEKVHSLEETSKKLAEIMLSVEEKKKSIETPPSEETAQYMTEQIKRKHRFLKKQYSEMEEFLRAEVDAKKKKDIKTINELESAKMALNTELNIIKQKLLDQRASLASEKIDDLLHQISVIETKRKEKEDLIIDMTSQKAMIQKQIEVSKKKLDLLQAKKDSLLTLKKSLELY